MTEINSPRPLGWTTLEEAEKLVKAGLPIETADMHYLDHGSNEFRALTLPYVNTASGVRPWVIPCWSLGALIQMLPLNIQTKDYLLHKYDLEFKLYSGYMVAYCIGQSHTPIIFTEKYETLIEACVEMIILLLKNDYYDNQRTNHSRD